MTQDEFDSLAIFVAVVEELRREPFFSEDNHERLGTAAGMAAAAVFCHPMFLKSAVLPFRKIWMERERCAFTKRKGANGIRELVFREHPDKKLLQGYHYWFYDSFDNKLKAAKEIIDLWLNTQIAHTGPHDFTNKRKWERDLVDFNSFDAKYGRARLEFEFRSSIVTVGSYYISFAEILAIPLFKKLRDAQGMKPSFEADVALKYNPYPDPKYRIYFDDVFWHLSRETVQDSFRRLLARQRFSDLGDFLRSLFEKVDEAIDFVSRCKTFDALLNAANVVVLTANPESRADLTGRFNANSFPEFGRPVRHGSVETFEGRKIRFYDAAQSVLSDVYIEFLAALKEARQHQRQPDKW